MKRRLGVGPVVGRVGALPLLLLQKKRSTERGSKKNVYVSNGSRGRNDGGSGRRPPPPPSAKRGNHRGRLKQIFTLLMGSSLCKQRSSTQRETEKEIYVINGSRGRPGGGSGRSPPLRVNPSLLGLTLNLPSSAKRRAHRGRVKRKFTLLMVVGVMNGSRRRPPPPSSAKRGNHRGRVKRMFTLLMGVGVGPVVGRVGGLPLLPLQKGGN